MQNWKKKLIWLVCILALLLVVPFLIPMQTYTRQIEAQATQALGVPVHIEALHVAILPTPRLNINNLSIGAHDEFSVASASVMPALSSIFSDNKVISRIDIQKPVIKKAALDFVAALSKQPKDPSNKTTVSVRQIDIQRATLAWPNFHLSEINANIHLDADNKPEKAMLDAMDGKVRLELTPKEDHQLITLTANALTLPVGPPLLIDSLKSEMTLDDHQLQITKLDSKLYGGKLDGAATLTWGKAYKLSGKLNLDNLSIREPARIMSHSSRVSGQLSSNGSFSATAKEASQLADNLLADIKFHVNDGVLYGFDLSQAPLMLIGKGKGGETKFDEFSGLLDITGKTYKFRDLKISSGVMSASGAVKINPNKSLDGLVDVEAKNSMNMAAIPLGISGTLENPKVFPTKAAIAGAVAGTAALGPAGTGLGLKAGKAIDGLKGLFGGDKK